VARAYQEDMRSSSLGRWFGCAGVLLIGGGCRSAPPAASPSPLAAQPAASTVGGSEGSAPAGARSVTLANGGECGLDSSV
jgi:hypothetical protein